MLGAGAGPWPAAGPPRPLTPVPRACARRVRLPTAGGKRLSQHIATNSWRSGLLCSRRGPGGGSCPGKRRIKSSLAPVTHRNWSPRTATCSSRRSEMLRAPRGWGRRGSATPLLNPRGPARRAQPCLGIAALINLLCSTAGALGLLQGPAHPHGPSSSSAAPWPPCSPSSDFPGFSALTGSTCQQEKAETGKSG